MNYKKHYEEDKELLELAFKLNEERKQKGLSKSKIAKDGRLTQHQFSQVRNENRNLLETVARC